MIKDFKDYLNDVKDDINEIIDFIKDLYINRTYRKSNYGRNYGWYVEYEGKVNVLKVHVSSKIKNQI